MKPAQLVLAQEVFEAALDVAPDARAHYVQSRLQADPELSDFVLQLLANDAQDVSALDAMPAAAIEDTLRALIPGEFAEGRQIGPYRIVEQIGDGGMGRVFRALREEQDLRQEVAIKLIRPELLNDELLRRFSGEKRALAALEYPGICRFIDAGVIDGHSPYVVMELVRGKPILEHCDLTALPVRQRLELFLQVLQAVAYAHRHFVLHRDIKSSNVLVADDGTVKLVDFGLAKGFGLDAASQATATADRFLTPGAAAPEQFSGDGGSVASDIYSLGLLGYQMLCGRSPFSGEGLGFLELVKQIQDVPPKPPSVVAAGATAAVARERGCASPRELARSIEGDLDAVVLTCLRKEPERRYTSVDRLIEDVRRVLDQQPIEARRSERWYVARKFIQRHRMAVGLGAALLSTLLVGSALVIWQALNLKAQRDIALLERNRAQLAVKLLEDSFVGADPTQAAGGEVTVAKVLEAARPRLAQLAQQDPQVYVGLARTVAGVELSLELDARAYDLAVRAIEIAGQSKASEDDLRQLWLIRASAALANGQLDDADAALREVIRIDGEPSLEWLVVKGRWARLENRLDESVEYLTRAVALSVNSTAFEQDWLEARWQLAAAHNAAKRSDEGLRVLDATVDQLEKAVGANHPKVALTRIRRIDMLMAAGRRSDAVIQAEQLVPTVEQLYGDGSSMMAMLRTSLATALYFEGRQDEGISQFERVVADWRKALGPTHLRTLRAMFNLAQVYSASERHESEAGKLYLEALQGSRESLGAASNFVFLVRMRYARHLLAVGEPVSALHLLVHTDAEVGLGIAGPTNRPAFADALTQVIDAACRPGVDPALPCERATQLLARAHETHENARP